MPLTSDPQQPDDPNDPIRMLIAVIGAVAKVLTKAEIHANKKAQKAMDDEYYKLQNRGTWDIKRVRERQSVENDALAKGKKIHVGRVFGIGVKKGAELPDEHPDQRYKGRYVFDGRRGYV